MLNYNRSRHSDGTSEFSFIIGDTLQLSLESDKRHKYYTKLIGALPGKTLLSTYPRGDGKLIPLKQGQRVTVRSLSQQSVMGFNTHVVFMSQTPYPYLHLQYPKTSGKIIVRNSQRVKSKLIVTVQVENIDGPASKPIPAATYDVSASGALIESSIRLGTPGDLVTLLVRLSIGGSNEYLTIPAVIRHVRFEKHPNNGKRLYFHGVEFQILEQHDIVLLHGFIYQQMASHAV